MIPLFYLSTAGDVLAVPEAVATSEISFEPHSTRVTIVAIPSLEEVTRSVNVTLMMSRRSLVSEVMKSGEVLSYTTALYGEPSPAERGLIVVKELPGDIKRVEILRKLNYPDYEVTVISPDEEYQIQAGSMRKIIRIADGVILRLPIREIARRFSSIFLTAATVIAPDIATFSNFASLNDDQSTFFISLPEQAYSLLRAVQTTSRMALANAVTQPQDGDTAWQPPIKMTSTGWTVFGVLLGVLVVVFVVSVGVAYGWYLAQYL